MPGPDDTIADDEVVLLRIPPTAPWFEPPDRVSSANFKLDRRRAEQGLSVYQQSAVSPDQLLNRPDAIAGSRVVAARVGDIRALRNAADVPLKLDVFPDMTRAAILVMRKSVARNRAN